MTAGSPAASICRHARNRHVLAAIPADAYRGMPAFDWAMAMVRLSAVKLRGVDQTTLACRPHDELVAMLCAMQDMTRREVRAAKGAMQASWDAELAATTTSVRRPDVDQNRHNHLNGCQDGRGDSQPKQFAL